MQKYIHKTYYATTENSLLHFAQIPLCKKLFRQLLSGVFYLKYSRKRSGKNNSAIFRVSKEISSFFFIQIYSTAGKKSMLFLAILT